MSYVYTMAFGTPAEKRTIIGMVHRAHAPVEGVSDGVMYNANDPALQLWVAATLYAAGVDIYEKVSIAFLLLSLARAISCLCRLPSSSLPSCITSRS